MHTQLTFPITYPTAEALPVGPVVYLFHFHALLGNPANTRALAGHYLGWTPDFPHRLADHLAGRGAALTRAAVERGIGWDTYILGAGDYRLEKRLKALKNSARLCPRCGTAHRAGRLHLPTPGLDQLALDLDGDPFDLPLPWPDRMDSFEYLWRRCWTGFTGAVPGDTSACDIPY